MKASELLLSLKHETLQVQRLDDCISVKYQDCYVKDGIALIDAHGYGQDFESACEHYLKLIRGETLIFEGTLCKRHEVKILG